MDEAKTPKTFDVIRRIVKIAKPEKIIIFGSYARGETKIDSDIDVLVIKRVKKRRRLAQKIYKGLIGIPVGVDVLVETPERLKILNNTPFYKRILEEGVIAYEKEES